MCIKKLCLLSAIFVLLHIIPASAAFDAVPPTSDKSLNVIRGFQKDHLGIDITAEIGSPVKAIASGNISWVGSLPNGLGCVSIEHENGQRTTYMPIRIVDTLSGWRSALLHVDTGDRIGFLEDGDDSSSEPHIHLGLKKGHGNSEQYFDPLAELDFLEYEEIVETAECQTDPPPLYDESQKPAELPTQTDPQTVIMIGESKDPVTSVEETCSEITSNNSESAQAAERQPLSAFEQDPVAQIPAISPKETPCAQSTSSAVLSRPVQPTENTSMNHLSPEAVSTKAYRYSRFERIQQICDLRQLSDILSKKISAITSAYGPTDDSIGSKDSRGSQKASPVTTSTLFLLIIVAICAWNLKSAKSKCLSASKVLKSGTITLRYVVRPPPMLV